MFGFVINIEEDKPSYFIRENPLSLGASYLCAANFRGQIKKSFTNCQEIPGKKGRREEDSFCDTTISNEVGNLNAT